MEKKHKIGVVCFDLQNFTSDFLNRLQEEVKEFAVIKAYPIIDKIGDVKLNFEYQSGESVHKHKVKTYSTNDKHTPEGMLVTPNYNNAIKCALNSDVILHYGIHSSTALISGFIGWCLRRKQLSVNQTLPLYWEERRKWWILWSKRVFFKFCQLHIAQSNVSVECLEKVYFLNKKDIKYIPFESGINSFKRKYDAIFQTIRTAEHKKEKINFLFVANLLKFKGVLLIIDAFAKLTAQQMNVSLTIVGPESIATSEPRIIDLVNYANDLGVGDLVSVLGEKSLNELVSLYQEADVFVLPTMKDTFGKVLVEAGIAGKPLITSDACGAVDTIVLHDINGYVFKAGSVDSLAYYMAKIAKEDLIRKMSAESSRIIGNYLKDTLSEAEEYKKALISIIPGI